MAENSQVNKEISNLIEFLIEDLKETGEHLRETDRKLSLLVQIYTGAFVLIATLGINKIIDLDKLLHDPSGLVLILVFVLFTRWLLDYALKSKETKVMYIHRMNFLRREMHYFLHTKNYDLTGYWTSPELSTSQDKTRDSASLNNGRKKPKRVGLDDLYPVALRWISVSLGIAFVFIFSKIITVNITWSFIKTPQFLFWLAIFILVPTIIWLDTHTMLKKNEKSVDDQIKKYQNSSLKRDQENGSKEINQEINKQNLHAKMPRRKIKKQVSNHD